jgi:hypothetical protein
LDQDLDDQDKIEATDEESAAEEFVRRMCSGDPEWFKEDESIVVVINDETVVRVSMSISCNYYGSTMK